MAENNQSKFTLVSSFVGYRNREDQTKVPPNIMIKGSQNVLIDVSGRLKIRKGYELDGQSSSVTNPIVSAYDWEEHKLSVIHLRNPLGSLQYRYIDSVGDVSWLDLKTGMSTEQPIRYTNYWEDTEKENVLLFVDGTSQIHQWNGAITTFASATVNTITKQGSETWGELGFYVTANKKIIIGGIEYTYTGGESTDTLTGVTPDPTSGGHSAGDVIHQSVYTIASTVPLPAGFNPKLIANLQNQIYYGDTDSNVVYVSAVNNYQSTSFSTPRIVGEGAKVTLRDNIVAFRPQESSMYVSAGKSQWYNTTKTLSSDNAKEFFDIVPLKSASQQGAKSQEVISNDKNSIIFISNEPVLTSLGRVANILETPQLGDYSFPIVNDFNNYNFTDASVKYYKNYIYVCIPQEGIIRIYNQTNPSMPFWEAPQTIPVSCLSVIDGELYGHSYNVTESYKLFTGYNDNGYDMQARAVFPFYNFGVASQTKIYNEFFVNGYIRSNTVLVNQQNLDIDGCSQISMFDINGSNNEIVCSLSSDASLGKAALGKHGLGTGSIVTDDDPLPPYFNVILVRGPRDFYHAQFVFESYGKDLRWEILSFGPLVSLSTSGNNPIKI